MKAKKIQLGNYQMGALLIELLIGLVLGGMVLVGLIKIFHNQKQHYDYQVGLIQLQETGVLISQLLQQELSTSGYVDCLLVPVLPLKQNNLQIYTSKNLPVDIRHYIKPVKEGSNIILSRQMDTSNNDLQESMSNDYQLVMSITPRYKSREKLIITDCQKVAVIEVATSKKIRNQNSQLITIEDHISKFNQGAVVGQLKQKIFYIAKTARKNQFKRDIYALYMSDENHREYELAEGVDDLKVSYGIVSIDKNGAERLQYESADSTISNQQARVLRVTLKISSIEPLEKHKKESVKKISWIWDIPLKEQNWQ
jgi:type IV pilus assembly protein PilW